MIKVLISLALNRRLTDKSVVSKEQIRPTLVNAALQKLTKINTFYHNINIDSEWEDLSEQSDPVLWKCLTGKKASQSNKSGLADSDDVIEGNDKFKERDLKVSSSPYPTVMYNVDGPNISPSEIVNISLCFSNFRA